MTTIKHNPITGITIIAPEGATTADRYEVHFQGFRGVINRLNGESDAALWERVTDWIDSMRQVLITQRSRLNPFGKCTIYAGHLEHADRVYARHMREQITDGLLEITGDTKSDSTSKVKAYALLAKLTGVVR